MLKMELPLRNGACCTPPLARLSTPLLPKSSIMLQPTMPVQTPALSKVNRSFAASLLSKWTHLPPLQQDLGSSLNTTGTRTAVLLLSCLFTLFTMESGTVLTALVPLRCGDTLPCLTGLVALQRAMIHCLKLCVLDASVPTVPSQIRFTLHRVSMPHMQCLKWTTLALSFSLSPVPISIFVTSVFQLMLLVSASPGP
jgi:hypothetical protein